MNAFRGHVVATLFMGTHTEYLLRCGELRVRVWSNAHDGVSEGDDVWVGVRERDLMAFPRTSEPDAAEEPQGASA
jgi:iron(III) transport system ATP-binding protein